MNEYFAKFLENAESNPDKTAVIYGENSVSYGELSAAACRFGETLETYVKGGRRIIPVTVSAGIEWYVEVLGIISVGLAAVPISEAIPPERARFMLSDSENAQNVPENAALIYYTSGSTGNPKGVILTDSGLAAYAKMHGDLFSQIKTEKTAIFSDPSFDAFLLISLPALLYGTTIYIAPDEARNSLVEIHKFLIRKKIETTFLTTQLAVSYMRAFDNKTLKMLFTGGEALRAFVPRSYKVFNLYGPGEATVYVTAHELCENDRSNTSNIPIGKATGQNRVMLIDGEIYISGPQLAAGYLNRPEETAAKFIANPYYKPDEDDISYRKMYKTGDRGECDENGEILFRGRADNQIKISGYRIEPEEIEAKIISCKGITAVKVMSITTNSGEAILKAVCVGDSDELTLRRELEKILPRPMIPSKFEFLTEMKTDPRTGKGVMI
jgi:non-ribosomal peptide synthetase component F